MELEAKTIIKHLEKIASHDWRCSDVFDDWLDLCLATMEALPAHLRSVRENKALAADTPETTQLFKRVKDRYQQIAWDFVLENFSIAFLALLNSTWDFQDVVGEVYMEFGNPNPRSGQFFTPFHLAELMAKMTGDIEREIYDRIKQAAHGDPLLESMILVGAMLEGDETDDWFFQRIIPVVAPKIKPVTVCDPACGSGVMFLAAAASVPSWALDLGFVQFYGMDIDATCCKMAQLNLMIYGLNGFNIKCALALSDAETLTLPDAYRSAYVQARVDSKMGIPVSREDVLLNVQEITQLSFF
jgi:hypothetical protein